MDNDVLSFPRTRGDEPKSEAFRNIVNKFSPHARG